MSNRLFTTVKVKKPRRNVFDLSHERKMSCNMGQLIPILCQEVVPGDKFRVNTEIMLRMAPMLAPVMHRINVYTHFFFVPNRLVWKGWENFITQKVNPETQELEEFPTYRIDDSVYLNLKAGSLDDYMGLPMIGNSNEYGDIRVSALPFRAYRQIWKEYYRDQNLQAQDASTFQEGHGFFNTGDVTLDEAHKVLGNMTNQGDNWTQSYGLLYRCWEKDYFTSALPWAQKGGEVSMPFDSPFSVTSKAIANAPNGTDFLPTFYKFYEGDKAELHLSDGNTDNAVELSGGTINDFRRASKLQEWLEKQARGGSRYIEQMFSHFGVRSSDARLQRPEYLGGGKSPVVISEVLQTSETNASPQGTMAGHGYSIGKSHSFKRYFEEHGYIIGIMSVMPRSAYYQGIPKHFLKSDPYDYYWPSFANLGEQPILNMELYAEQHMMAGQSPFDVFGYTPRYAEYKFNNSTVHGDFRTSLRFWHMVRHFVHSDGADPKLNSAFVECKPTQRIFAVDESLADPPIPREDWTDKLWIQMYHNIQAIRTMPKFGIPQL